MINPLEVPARLVLFVCLMLLVGIPIGMRALGLPILATANVSAQPLLRSTYRIQAVALVGFALGAALLLYVQVLPLELDYTMAEWQVFIVNTTVGQMTLVRIGLAVVGLVLLLATRRVGWSGFVGGLVGLAGQATLTRTSHTYAMGSGAISLAADFAHLVGGGLWAGGLVVMALVLTSLLQMHDDGRLPALTIQLIRRFGMIGIAGVTLVCATGVLLSTLHIAQPITLVNSLYGVFILAKVVGVVLAIGLAALHKFVVQRRMYTRSDVQRFAATLHMEIIMVLLVFVGAALLTAAPPPMRQMSGDVPQAMFATTNTSFQNLLSVAAIGLGVLGLVALSLEWRQRH